MNRECEAGSNSKQKAIVWGSSDKDQAMFSTSMELVDIPVYYGEDKSPLTDISSKVNSKRNIVKENRSRKWNRLEGKKRRAVWGG